MFYTLDCKITQKIYKFYDLTCELLPDCHGGSLQPGEPGGVEEMAASERAARRGGEGRGKLEGKKAAMQLSVS